MNWKETVEFATNRLDLSFWSRQKLPVITQVEVAECGLACLAMLSTYFGNRLDIHTLRQALDPSAKGLNVRTLINLAERIDLIVRPLKPTIEQISDLQLPCILHWGFNHFVVLKRIRGDIYTVHDPAIGCRELDSACLSNFFTGVALEVIPSTSFKKGDNQDDIKLSMLTGKVRNLYKSLGIVLVMALSIEILSLTLPFLMQWLVDDALVSADRPLVSVLCIAFMAISLIQIAIQAARSWFTICFSTSLNYQWVGNAFSHMLNLSSSFFERRHLGDIVSRFSSITALQRGLTTQIVELFIDILLVVGAFGMMLVYSLQLACIAFASVTVYLLARYLFLAPARTAASEVIINTAKQQTYFIESIRGIQSIKVNSQEGVRRTSWLNAQADQTNSELAVSKIGVVVQTTNSTLFSVERMLVVYIAANAVLDNRFSIGMLIAFLSYKDVFTSHAASAIDKTFDLRILRLQAARVADILLSPGEVSSNAIMDENSFVPSIEFDGVSFRYSATDSWVIKDLSFKVSFGEFVALNGPSGCGKTTVVKLILGLLRPTMGHVLIGGRNLNQTNLKMVRRMIGAVMQDDQLFSGSILDNISLFDVSAEAQTVYAAAALASVHEEIDRMPMGYQTLIGDLGTGLSGGQKQRILLARALFRQPRLIVLDEATSHLDVANEHSVSESVRQLGLTGLVVAHRPDTIARADRVLTMSSGRLLQNNDSPA